MRLIKIFFFFFFLRLTCLSQESESFLQQYASYPDDTNKVNLLFGKGFAYRNTDLPTAINYAKACYGVALKINNKPYLAKALNFMGILKSQMGLNKEALVDFKKAYELRVQTNDTLNEAILLNNMGNAYSGLQDNKQALLFYERSLQLAKNIGNERWTKGALFSMAELQANLKMYKQAEGNLYTLINWAQNKNEYEILGMCYKNMSSCKINAGDTSSAEAYEMQALDIAEMTEDDILRTDALCGLGEILLMKKNYPAALKDLTEALSIAEKNKYNEGLIICWKNLARYHKETNSFKEAYYYLNKHDSAIASTLVVPTELSADLWKVKDMVTESKTRSFSLKDHIFDLLIMISLLVLLLVVLWNRGNEQKE